VVAIDHIEFGNVLAVTYDDSSILFLNPATMSNFDTVQDENVVSSMAQVGFNFPIDIAGKSLWMAWNFSKSILLTEYRITYIIFSRRLSCRRLGRRMAISSATYGTSLWH
jgi:hypothetical protein